MTFVQSPGADSGPFAEPFPIETRIAAPPRQRYKYAGHAPDAAASDVMTPPSPLSEPATEAGCAPSPREFSARRVLIRAALVSACVAVWLVYSGPRSPWIRLNLPGGVHGGNPVSGYTSLYNGDFYHKENFYALQHVDLLKGNYASFQERIGFCDRRMFYAVAGNLLTLVLSSYHALHLINLAMFLLSAHFVRRMTEILFHDPDAGLLAAALFVGSTMATVHAGDISPHFVAIAFSYGWGVLMVRLALRSEPITWKENLGHAAILGLWSLTYTSFAFGLVVYLALLLRRRQWRLMAAPIAFCFVMPQLQLLILRFLGFGYSTDVEKLLAMRGLEMHLANFREGPLSYAAFLAVEFVNYLVNDNPLNVVLGVAALVTLRHPARWMLVLLYLAPIAVVFPFIGTTTARGYVVAGNTIVLFPLAAHAVLAAARKLRARVGPVGAWGPVCLLLGAQLAWGQASAFGWLYPTGSYGMGIFKHSLVVRPVEFARMTGDLNDKPVLLGGDEPATTYLEFDPDFGVQPVFPDRWRNPFAQLGFALRAFLTGLCVEVPVLLCAGAVVYFLRPAWWGRSMTTALAVLIPATLVFGAPHGVDPQAYLKFEDRIEVREGESLAVRVVLSPEFRELLRQASRDHATAQIHVHYRAGNARLAQPAELKIFDHVTRETRLTLPLAELINDLEQNGGALTCRLTPAEDSGGILLRSWQRNRPEEGRTVTEINAEGEQREADWFPSLEIRVPRSEQRYPFQSLIARWDPARPVGYALIGF